MKIIPLDKIEIRNRQRTEIDRGPLGELKESILARGLLHPPVVWHDAISDKYVLVAGERRLKAIGLIAAESALFSCDGAIITPGEVPITEVMELNAATLMEAELEENIIRVDLSWQDRMRALAAIHLQRQSENPTQTRMDTARELAAKGGLSGGPAHPTNLQKQITQALIVSEKLNDPKVAKARNANEAQALILQQEEASLHAELARRRLKENPSNIPPILVRRGSMLEVLPSLPEGGYDLILADPPYGIEAGSAGFRGRTMQHHNYKDDAETGQRIAQCIFEEGWRLTKSRANLFLFCDIKRWFDLRSAASRIGWEVFPRPIIWQKSESEGLAPWGRQGFRLTYETILYATRGGRGLITSPVDIINVKRVSRNLRVHAAEKPVDLLKLLIDCSTLPGDSVLDPCCGSGSTLVACKELNRRALGIEIDEDSYNLSMSNVFGETEECSNDTEQPISEPTDSGSLLELME